MVIMYNQEGESKYHVANILSSMANGGEPTVVVQVSSYAAPSAPYSSGMSSVTASTLTPTSLNNFERTFIELQSVPTATTSHNPVSRSGFIPPVVSSMSSSQDGESDSSTSCDDYLPTQPKKIRIGDKTTTIMSKYEIENPQRKTHRRHLKDDDVSPEEAARRNLRRERNKVAAAKCRQRRVDHTNRLLTETEKLELEQSAIEQEIQTLQQEKDQLEFILQAHSPLCKATRNNGALKIKMEPGISGNNCKSSNNKLESSKKDVTSRPSTLPLKRDLKNQLTSAGIAITTPSSGFYSFSLDTMVDHTGLTPLTGSLGHTGLTPITSMPSSCSSEATKKSSTSSENSDSVKSPSSLISL